MTRLAERSRNATLLLVEDSPGDVVLFRRAMERMRLRIDLKVAISAEEGLELLGTGLRPDLIILDLNLPHMNGFDFLDVVKGNAGLRRIPVLVFSTSTADSDVAACYDRHANGYLSKPVGNETYETILATLEAYWFRLMQTPPAGAGDVARRWQETDGEAFTFDLRKI